MVEPGEMFWLRNEMMVLPLKSWIPFILRRPEPLPRFSAAMADRNLPRSEQASTPGLPRRIRVPAQPPQNTGGSLPDPPRTRNRSEINHVRADPRSEGSQQQPIGDCLVNQIRRTALICAKL